MKRAASAFLRFADLAANAGVVVAAVSLGLIALLLFAEILTRLVSGGTLGDTWEFATYFMALTFLLGAAYTLRTGGHVRVSLLHFTNPKRDAVVEGAACVFGLALSIFIAYALTDLAWQSYVRGIRSPTPSQLPLYLPRVALALGAWLLALQMSARLVALLTGVPLERPVPESEP